VRRALEGFLGAPQPVRDPVGAYGSAVGPRRALEELLWALEGLFGVLEGLRGVLWGALRPVRGSEGACGWLERPCNMRRALEGLLRAPQSVRDPVNAFWGPVWPWRSLSAAV